jgi:hypothetical protein
LPLDAGPCRRRWPIKRANLTNPISTLRTFASVTKLRLFYALATDAIARQPLCAAAARGRVKLTFDAAALN